MNATKKELIKQYQEGTLKDHAIYNPSAFDAYVLVEWDDESVFGYYQYEGKKEFFKVKHTLSNEDTSFRVHRKTFKGSEFLRI